MSSIDTPSQNVSNFDHVVTQWMSRVILVCGSALNSAQFHVFTGLTRSFSVKDQSSVLTRGVGPSRKDREAAFQELAGRQPRGRLVRAAAPSQEAPRCHRAQCLVRRALTRARSRDDPILRKLDQVADSSIAKDSSPGFLSRGGFAGTCGRKSGAEGSGMYFSPLST